MIRMALIYTFFLFFVLFMYVCRSWQGGGVGHGFGDRSSPKVSPKSALFSADLTETGSGPGFPPKDLMIIIGFWGKNIPHEFL